MPRVKSTPKKWSEARKARYKGGNKLARVLTVNALRSEVKQIVKLSEKKRIRTQGLSASIDVPKYIHLSAIAAGTGEDDRDGLHVNLLSGDLVLCFSPNLNATVATFIGWMVVVDRQSNNAAPVLTDILEYPSGDPFTGTRHPRHLDRFWIAKRGECIMNCRTANAGGIGSVCGGEQTNYIFREHIDFQKMPKEFQKTVYAGDTAGIPLANSVYLVVYTSNQTDFADGTYDPNFTYGFSLQYSDR